MTWRIKAFCATLGLSSSGLDHCLLYRYMDAIAVHVSCLTIYCKLNILGALNLYRNLRWLFHGSLEVLYTWQNMTHSRYHIIQFSHLEPDSPDPYCLAMHACVFMTLCMCMLTMKEF